MIKNKLFFLNTNNNLGFPLYCMLQSPEENKGLKRSLNFNLTPEVHVPFLGTKHTQKKKKKKKKQAACFHSFNIRPTKKKKEKKKKKMFVCPFPIDPKFLKKGHLFFFFFDSQFLHFQTKLFK